VIHPGIATDENLPVEATDGRGFSPSVDRQSRASGGSENMQNVLVVEDEYFIADELSRELKVVGVNVIGPAPTLQDAFALLRSGLRVDAAVLDINLRDEMVYPVAAELRRGGVPFVFATGYDAAVVPAEFTSVPLWGKPFEPRALALTLRDLASASPG
jgi:DNA-binding response OmpR family regulator